MLLPFFVIFAFVHRIEATISTNFYNYIQQQFGAEIAQQVARNDFGSFGSYGGGNHQAGTRTK